MRKRRCALVAATFAVVAAPSPAGASYGWPVRPFDQPHPIRGGFCDPRLGARQQMFHFGVDVAAADGTAVYAVAPGIVRLDRRFPRTIHVTSAGTHVFSYWHVVPAVEAGAFVGMHGLLGHVMPGAGHVHLTERVAGTLVNPLRPGALTPYADATPPLITATVALRNGSTLDLGGVGGRIDLVAEVVDVPELSLPLPWARSVLTPATIAWRLVAAGGGIVLPWRTVFDCSAAKTSDSLFWNVFAPATSQNRPWAPGSYWFWLQRRLDTTLYPDGEYAVQVVASDARGNVAEGAFLITIHNGPDREPRPRTLPDG